MLVLSRKIGEKIHVGNDITIEVRRVAGNRVTLAVDAPREVRILRGELKDAAMAFEPDDPRQPTATLGRHGCRDARADQRGPLDAARPRLSDRRRSRSRR